MEALSAHLQQIKHDADSRQEKHPMVDKFCPTIPASDGPILVRLVTPYVSHYFTSRVVVKREPHPDELGLDIKGLPVVIPYIRERIRIEAANLQFIARFTTIPVPAFLGVWQENGLWHLKTGLVQGAVELDNIDKDRLPAAVASVEAQLQSDILPQLRLLRRWSMGCSDPAQPVVPPHLCWQFKDRRVWSPMKVEPGPNQSDKDAPYVFCHTDLGRQNILVDPDTFRIVSIIDWETAGFWPPDWELPFWRVNDHIERYKMASSARPVQRAAITATEPEEAGLGNVAETEEQGKAEESAIAQEENGNIIGEEAREGQEERL